MWFGNVVNSTSIAYLFARFDSTSHDELLARHRLSRFPSSSLSENCTEVGFMYELAVFVHNDFLIKRYLCQLSVHLLDAAFKSFRPKSALIHDLLYGSEQNRGPRAEQPARSYVHSCANTNGVTKPK